MSGLGGLLKDLEQDCFSNSEQRVLAAFVVRACRLMQLCHVRAAPKRCCQLSPVPPPAARR